MFFCGHWFKYNIAHFSPNKLLSLHYFSCQVRTVNVFSHQNKVNNGTVFASCKITCKIYTDQITDSVNHLFNNPVNTGLLHYYIMYIAKQWVVTVSLKTLFFPVAKG